MSEEIADSVRVIITRNDLQVRIKKPFDLKPGQWAKCPTWSLEDQDDLNLTPSWIKSRFVWEVEIVRCYVWHNSVAILILIGRKGCELTSGPCRAALCHRRPINTRCIQLYVHSACTIGLVWGFWCPFGESFVIHGLVILKDRRWLLQIWKQRSSGIILRDKNFYRVKNGYCETANYCCPVLKRI